MAAMLNWSLVCFLLAQGAQALIPQYIQLFEKDGCFGKSAYDSFEGESSLETGVGNNTSSISLRGLWTIRLARKNNPEVTQTITMADSDGSLCLLELDDFEILSADRYLPNDLEESALLFFDDVLSGNYTLITKAEETFKEPQIFLTQVVSGLKGYTVYEGTNFNGTSVYISEDFMAADQGYGLVAYTDTLTVGSVRLGRDEGATAFTGKAITRWVTDMRVISTKSSTKMRNSGSRGEEYVVYQ